MNLLDGQKFVKQKEFGKALKIFLKLENKNTKNINIFFYLGLIYYELNKYDKSITYYNKCLEINPKSVSTLHNLAIVNQTIGNFDKAKEIYLSILNIDKSNIRSYYGLFTIDNNYLSDEMYENLLFIKQNKKINLYEKGFVNFLLSKKEKKRNNFKKEIEILKNSHEEIFNSNLAFNLSSQFYYEKIISKKFSKIKINNLNHYDSKKKSNEPIFIIGLPRSGSTLIESILTSNEQKTHTFGECHVVNMSVLNEIGNKIYSKNFNEKNFEFSIDIKNMKKNIYDKYLQLDEDFLKRKKFIDKSLENFFNIEIICNIFPNAKFIHTFRNSIDSVISIYQSMLPELSWTHKIEDILNYIDNYLKVMKFFNLKYSKSIMNINLEDFTKSSEQYSKNIYEFCNLKWSDNALKFYKRKDLYSKTLSYTQVRNKVEKYDLEKYKPYFNLLKKYKKNFNWLTF